MEARPWDCVHDRGGRFRVTAGPTMGSIVVLQRPTVQVDPVQAEVDQLPESFLGLVWNVSIVHEAVIFLHTSLFIVCSSPDGDFDLVTGIVPYLRKTIRGELYNSLQLFAGAALEADFLVTEVAILKDSVVVKLVVDLVPKYLVRMSLENFLDLRLGIIENRGIPGERDILGSIVDVPAASC